MREERTAPGGTLEHFIYFPGHIQITPSPIWVLTLTGDSVFGVLELHYEPNIETAELVP